MLQLFLGRRALSPKPVKAEERRTWQGLSYALGQARFATA